MTPISAIKTREDAIALIEGLQTPQAPTPPKPLGENPTPAQKAAYDTAVADHAKREALATREASLIAAVKDFAIARINALPSECKVVGIELRADTGDIEAVAFRLIHHK